MLAAPATAPPRRLDARWRRRPVVGWAVRIGSLLGPVVGSLVVAWLLTSVSPTTDRPWLAVTRWVLIAAASSVALVRLERATRRLLPIAALYDLTLAFPDRAPSRFKVALRTGTTQQLERRIAEVRSGGAVDPTVSAGQRVIELVTSLSVHDNITRGHSERVRAYSQLIADEMGLSDAERDRLRWAALLHDVGKLLVPTDLLNKTGTLTADEYAIIQTHPENGRRIIEELIPWLGDSARAVWEHHERWDGGGYPRGLSGTDISLAARIVAVGDAYDVMTSARSYKDPISPKAARAELARCAGSHFDPAVVRAFLNLSIGRVRRAAGPLSWAAQLTFFPTTALGSAPTAGGAVVLSGALSASSVALVPALPARFEPDVIDVPAMVAAVGDAASGAQALLTFDDGDDDDEVAGTTPMVVVTIPPRQGVAMSVVADDSIVVTPPGANGAAVPLAADDAPDDSPSDEPAPGVDADDEGGTTDVDDGDGTTGGDGDDAATGDDGDDDDDGESDSRSEDKNDKNDKNDKKDKQDKSDKDKQDKSDKDKQDKSDNDKQDKSDKDKNDKSDKDKQDKSEKDQQRKDKADRAEQAGTDKSGKRQIKADDGDDDDGDDDDDDEDEDD